MPRRCITLAFIWARRWEIPRARVARKWNPNGARFNGRERCREHERTGGKRRGKRGEGKFHIAEGRVNIFFRHPRINGRRRRGDARHIGLKTRGNDTDIFQSTYQEVAWKFDSIWYIIDLSSRTQSSTNSSHANPSRKFFYMSSGERRGHSGVVILPKIHRSRPGERRYTAFILAFI